VRVVSVCVVLCESQIYMCRDFLIFIAKTSKIIPSSSFKTEPIGAL
jgi:hypothetical protein